MLQSGTGQDARVILILLLSFKLSRFFFTIYVNMDHFCFAAKIWLVARTQKRSSMSPGSRCLSSTRYANYALILHSE